MTKCEQYLEYKKQWSEAAFKGDDALDKELTKKGLALRDTFSKEDWEELIGQSTGRAKYEYKRMMNAKFSSPNAGDVMIEEGTHFSDCTDEQKEWAKQYDESGTEYYEMIWGNPKKYSVALSDPIWRDGCWEDVEW